MADVVSTHDTSESWQTCASHVANFEVEIMILSRNRALYGNSFVKIRHVMSHACPKSAFQVSSSSREFCLWHFEGVVLIMLDKLCVLMVLATIFQLNLGAKESGNTLLFRLAQRKDLVVSTKSSRVL